VFSRLNLAIPDEEIEGDAVFDDECKHSGLLWALESTAWSSQYFASSVRALADLAEVDPDGRWSNRPVNSLRDFFLLGFPQTFASPKERLAACPCGQETHDRMENVLLFVFRNFESC
jgi:hypothetical protein